MMNRTVSRRTGWMSEVLGSSVAGLICAGTVAHAAHNATFEVDTEKGM